MDAKVQSVKDNVALSYANWFFHSFIQSIFCISTAPITDKAMVKHDRKSNDKKKFSFKLICIL